MIKYVSISKAAEIIGVTPKTLRLWDKEGVLKSYRTPKGHRKYILEEIENMAYGIKPVKIQDSENKIKVYIYARVSTKKQYDSGNLDRQVERLKEYCKSKGYEVSKVYEEVASGLNENRPKLQRMLENLSEVDRIVAEYPDRLARFGLNYINLMAKQHNVNLEFVDSTVQKSISEEMAEDIISIITCFSAKLYGARGGKKVKRTLELLASGNSVERGDIVEDNSAGNSF